MSKERDSKKRIAFVQLFAEAAASAVPDEIQVVPTGKWSHPVYGEMEIAPTDIAEFVQNFDRKIRNDIPITQGHDNGMSGGELPAVCWFTNLFDRGQDGLWGAVKWTDEGRRLLTSGAFKYFSPEFYEQYSDPETGVKYGHVLVGGALTNKPYFKELEPVATFSEPDIMSQFNDTMEIKDIVSKKVEELSDEEKGFLADHKDELTDEQKTAFESVLPAEGGAGDENGSGADEGNGDDKGDGKGDEGRNMSEKGLIKISAAEIATLRSKADAGAQAFAEVEKMKLEKEVEKLVFSSTNAEGRILPKSKGAIVEFMRALSEKQRDQFRNIINNLPKVSLSFKEIGDGGTDAPATKAEEVNARVQEKIKASEGKMKFSAALSAVLKEDPALASEYNAEMQEQRG